MKILFNNNIYECNTDSALLLTVDMGSTSVGLPIANRIWVTDTKDITHEIEGKWEVDGSENIILSEIVDDDCWHDHAESSIHGPRFVDIVSSDDDRLSISGDLEMKGEDGVNLFQPINIVLSTSIDDIGTTHQRTLVIYGKGTNIVYAKITVIGETISEDMDIAAMAELQGYRINPEDNFVFYEVDPAEPVFSAELLNRKRKEYLLCIDRLHDKIGSRDGLRDVIKFFGYDDMFIGTMWKVSNVDSPYYKGFSIRYTDANGKQNTLDTDDIHYKQINRSILVYKIVKTLDVPFDKLPHTAEVNSYGIDGNSVKLARLREVMNDQFMPAAIPVREILGECDVYYAVKCINQACDNLTEYKYSEHNIRLSIAKEDIYEFRLSRYYALAKKLFGQDIIDKVISSAHDCMPNTFAGCMLYRLKRIYTIYEFLKDRAEVDKPDIVVWKGAKADGSDTISVPYFIYMLTTPKVEGEENFIADTYSGIHSEAITLMMFIFESFEYLTNKLHLDAVEFPDYLWVIWEETAENIPSPVEKEDAYDSGIEDTFVDRYCGCVNLSLSSQDAFHYKWNDIHSWWDHTARFEGGEFKDGMTWANFASITKITWTLTNAENANYKYTYICEKGDSTKSIPHEVDGVADYDIYGVPVSASIYVYHTGTYHVEAIIEDLFGHKDRLFVENAVHVHRSSCYLTGIAQNVVRAANTLVEDEIEADEHVAMDKMYPTYSISEVTDVKDAINKFCNAFLYGPMRYNRVFSNTNGLLAMKLPYFPKIVTHQSHYYLYPFTIGNAIDAHTKYSYKDEKDADNSRPFSLPNLIPSQPTAIILPMDIEQPIPSDIDSEGPAIKLKKIKLGNTGEMVDADCIVVIKGTELHKYVLASTTDKVIEDLESLPFFSDYKWQVTYMPGSDKDCILMGVAKEITSDTDIDDVYFTNQNYTEYVDIVKPSSPLEYEIEYNGDTYNVTFMNDKGDSESMQNITYPRVMAFISQKYIDTDEKWYVHDIQKASTVNSGVPRVPGGMFYDAFIGVPHYGTWNFISGGYVKLKQYSWVVVSIDNNNIPAKHDIIWDIERRNVLDNPNSIDSPVNIRWVSIFNDDEFYELNKVHRETQSEEHVDFPQAYLPYMFSTKGQYRIRCKFKDINGDIYEPPFVVVDIE